MSGMLLAVITSTMSLILLLACSNIQGANTLTCIFKVTMISQCIVFIACYCADGKGKKNKANNTLLLVVIIVFLADLFFITRHVPSAYSYVTIALLFIPFAINCFNPDLFPDVN